MFWDKNDFLIITKGNSLGITPEGTQIGLVMDRGNESQLIGNLNFLKFLILNYSLNLRGPTTTENQVFTQLLQSLVESNRSLFQHFDMMFQKFMNSLMSNALAKFWKRKLLTKASETQSGALPQVLDEKDSNFLMSRSRDNLG